MLTRAGAARPPGGATLALRPSSSALDAGERGAAEGPRSAVQTALPGPRRPGVESWFCPDQRHAPAHPGTPRHAPARPVLWRRSLSPLIQKGSGVLPVLTGLRSLGWSLRSALPDPSAPVGSPRPPETHHRLRHWCPRDACGSHHLPRLSDSFLSVRSSSPARRTNLGLSTLKMPL